MSGVDGGGLTAEEREALIRVLHNEGDGGIWEHFDARTSRLVADALAPTVERIVATRVAEARAEAPPVNCDCGHAEHQHDREAVPALCMICGDDSMCGTYNFMMLAIHGHPDDLKDALHVEVERVRRLAVSHLADAQNALDRAEAAEQRAERVTAAVEALAGEMSAAAYLTLRSALADPAPREYDDGGPRVREAVERAERDAEVAARALREAADEFEARQRKVVRLEQRLAPWTEACDWLRDRAATLEGGEGS